MTAVLGEVHAKDRARLRIRRFPGEDPVDQQAGYADHLVCGHHTLGASFIRAVEHGPRHAEVTTDRARSTPRVIEELIAAACRVTEQYTSNPVEADRA
jgi:hypothetical protein